MLSLPSVAIGASIATTPATRVRFARRLPMPALACVVLLSLLGCAAIGVPATSDPDRKLAQAYQLMAIERFVPAERLIQETLDIYTKQGNEIGMAEAYHTFGNFYKNEIYHTKFARFYKSLGTYDGTYMRSIDNFSTARALFEKNENYAGVTKCLIGLGNAYSLRAEKDKACVSYDDALGFYNKAKQKDPSVRLPILTKYRDAEELINAFKQSEGCQ
jgi:tetratricopeptide (TPR) repeat protein